MKKQLKIIIFDGTFKTTPFINRLVKGLEVNHQVYILGFNEHVQEKVSGISYIELGSSTNKLLFITTTLRIALKSGSFNTIFNTVKQLLYFNRNKLRQQNFELTLEKLNPTIIHVQWPSLLPWFEEVLKLQKTPVILSQRGYQNNVRPFVDVTSFKYLRHWYPKVAGFHSVSKAISKKGDLIYDHASKIDHVVLTGLNLNTLKFYKSYKKSIELAMLSIGRPHWIKGYTDALTACNLLKLKGVKFRYTIIGAKNNEELLFLRKSYNLEQEVMLLDKITQQEVYTKMKESQLVLLPSLEEGIANVCVEAMALGTPVISTNCGGMEELITHEDEGWIVPIRNPQALANQIMAFTKLDVGEIDNVRKNARIKVEQQYSEVQMVTGMEALYREVLERFVE